jgi:hypothetical protein
MHEKTRLAEIEGIWQGLKLLSKKFKNYVANQPGNRGNNEICDGENIFNREN